MKLKIKILAVALAAFFSTAPLAFADTFSFSPASVTPTDYFSVTCDYADSNYIYLFDTNGNSFNPWGGSVGKTCSELNLYLNDANCDGNGHACSTGYLIPGQTGEIKAIVSDLQDVSNLYCNGSYADCLTGLPANGATVTTELGTILTITSGGGGGGGGGAFTAGAVNSIFSSFVSDTGGSIAFGITKILVILACLIGLGMVFYYFQKWIGSGATQKKN